jgi:hypothetical protein
MQHPFILEYTPKGEEIMAKLVEEITELKEAVKEAGGGGNLADDEMRKKRIEAEQKLKQVEIVMRSFVSNVFLVCAGSSSSACCSSQSRAAIRRVWRVCATGVCVDVYTRLRNLIDRNRHL